MAGSCVLQRTLSRFSSNRSDTQHPTSPQTPPSRPAVCRQPLYLVSLQRYARDLGSAVFFSRAVLSGDSLYDVTVTDGDCRLRVTLEPHLNRLVERNVLRCGCRLRNVSLAPGLSVRGEEGERGGNDNAVTSSYRLVGVELGEDGQDGGSLSGVDVDSLPWFGSTEPGDDGGLDPSGSETVLLPLRASRSTFLPLWNNTDYSGEVWRETPPPSHCGEEEETEEEEIGEVRPGVTIGELQKAFLSGRRGVARTVVRRHLIVRIINKSHLVYYGKTDRNCECPYKAVMEVCDGSGSVCVVLWNSVCVDWYRCLRPGQILRLGHYRVKESYDSKETDIEISINSRNPAAQISLLPESSISPDCRPPRPSYRFYCGKELLDCPHGNVCDVIGLVTFAGRPERIRSKDGQGAELLQYRWLRLEDGTSEQPIMVKLFSTSQPETHGKIRPLSVVVCTKLKLVRSSTDSRHYLTNTSYTQAYCTGSGHHSEMSYRKLRPVRLFLQWLQSLDDEQVLSRAVVGGFFIYPPPPISLEAYIKDRKGEPGFLRGAELEREVDRLCYRERRTLCIQATVTMVTYCRRGEEDQCLVWTDRRASLSPILLPGSPPPPSSLSSPPHPSSSPRLSRAPLSPPHPSSSPRISRAPLSPPHPSSSPRISCAPLSPLPPSSPRLSSTLRLPLSSPSPSLSSLPPRPSPSPSLPRLPPSSPNMSVNQLSPRPLRSGGSCTKRKLFQTSETSRKRQPLASFQAEPDRETGVLWEASFEFLEKSNNDDDDDESDDEDEDTASFVTAPLFPAAPRVAMETLPLRYSHAHREEQAVAMEMQAGEFRNGGDRMLEDFPSDVEEYYTLSLRALSDSVLVDVVFLPSSSSSSSLPLPHPNSWFSILSHGAFSSHTPPPSPADLIAMATQLTNQRLVCILEACHLGGARTEIVLSRAFSLTD